MAMDGRWQRKDWLSRNILYNCGSVEEQKPFKRHSLSVIYFRFNYLSAKTTTTAELLALRHSLRWWWVGKHITEEPGSGIVKSWSSKNPMNFKFIFFLCSNKHWHKHAPLSWSPLIDLDLQNSTLLCYQLGVG